jgi:alkylation response protein AidB-like acyl-CoA dehydrogenase
MLAERAVYNEEHHLYREVVRKFIRTEVLPHFHRWEAAGIVDRGFWDSAGDAGLLCPQLPEEYGGAGGTFKHNAVVVEEFAYAGVAGPQTDLSVHNDVCAGYLQHFGSEVQKLRWLSGMASGNTVCAIAMTEPGTGSDLQAIKTTAVRVGENFRVRGAKTFISNGQHCDLVIVVVRTSPEAGAKGISLILVEADRPGFRRGRNLEKLGHLSSDTSELFFDDVEVPVSNLLGPEGDGFGLLMRNVSIILRHPVDGN